MKPVVVAPSYRKQGLQYRARVGEWGTAGRMQSRRSHLVL